MMTMSDEKSLHARIKVIGVGGGGSNAINTMIDQGVLGVEFAVINTDAQALETSRAPHKIQIGKNLTKGLGAGASPEIAERACEEDKEEIHASLQNANMVFIAAGMGGGTGTGAAPIVASIAKKAGALTVAIVTKPFQFEGSQRRKRAEEGIKKLREQVDSLIIIPNDRIFALDNKLPFIKAFAKVDEILLNAVSGISDIILKNGHINVDFADVKRVLDGRGDALMGIGIASGANRAQLAAQMAISSPLLEGVSIEGAAGALVNISGDSNLGMDEVNQIMSFIHSTVGDNSDIITGVVFNESFKDFIQVTVIAAGFKKNINDSIDFNPAITMPVRQAPPINLTKPNLPNLKTVESPIFSLNSLPLNAAANAPLNNSHPIRNKFIPENQLEFTVNLEKNDLIDFTKPINEPSINDHIPKIQMRKDFRNSIDKNNLDDPAFLRKQMD